MKAACGVSRLGNTPIFNRRCGGSGCVAGNVTDFDCWVSRADRWQSAAGLSSDRSVPSKKTSSWRDPACPSVDVKLKVTDAVPPGAADASPTVTVAAVTGGKPAPPPVWA